VLIFSYVDRVDGIQLDLWADRSGCLDECRPDDMIGIVLERGGIGESSSELNDLVLGVICPLLVSTTSEL
jgi:hypothetical protein